MDLCDKIPASTALTKYLQYCKKLKFSETPNYEYLRDLFRDIARKYNYSYDGKFDWVLRWNVSFLFESF